MIEFTKTFYYAFIYIRNMYIVLLQTKLDDKFKK